MRKLSFLPSLLWYLHMYVDFDEPTVLPFSYRKCRALIQSCYSSSCMQFWQPNMLRTCAGCVRGELKRKVIFYVVLQFTNILKSEYQYNANIFIVVQPIHADSSSAIGTQAARIKSNFLLEKMSSVIEFLS